MGGLVHKNKDSPNLPDLLDPQQTIRLTSRRVRPNMVLVPRLPPQGQGDEEKNRSVAAAGITWAQPSLIITDPVSTEFSDWSNYSPRQKIFTHDWLVPLSKSRRERESVTRRLRARVAAEPWKCEFLWRLDRERSRLLPQRASGIGQDFRGFVFKGSWCKGGGE